MASDLNPSIRPSIEALPSRLLIVDDDLAMLQALSGMVELRMKGVDIDTCVSGAAALERIGETDYDVIVSDVKMPGMDGFQLMERVLKVRPTTPTLLVTGHGDHDMGVKALDAGAYAFIPKPIDRDYFIAWLKRSILLRQLSRAVEQQNHTLERTVQERTAELEGTNRELKESEARLAVELTDIKLLQDISARLIHEEHVEALYERILDAGMGVMQSDMASMQIIDERQDALRMLAWRGFDQAFGETFAWNRPDTKTSCSVAKRVGHRVIVPDVEACDFIAGTPALDDHRKTGIRAVQSTPLLSRSGKMVGIISTYWRNPHQPSERDLRLLDVLARQAADLIERKQAEDTLRQRTAQFEALLNQAPLGVYLVDGDFRIRQVNPTALPVFGPIPSLIGRDFDEVIHMLWPKTYADEVVRLFRHTLETGEPYVTHELIEERRDREVTEYYEWQIHRIPLPEGRYGVVCYFRDISAQVLAREAIAESEERFRTLADYMSQFAWMADATGWIFWYNRRWYEYTGTTFEEMQGWGWQKVHHPDHLNRVVKKWRRAHETGESWEDTFPLRGTDGRYRWFLSRAMPIRDERGHIVRWFGTNTDVTEQRAAEEEVRRLLDDARAHEIELREKQEQLMQAAKLASIGQLATGVAHEINNPLNNIGLFVGNVLDAMKRGELVSDKAIQHLDAALEQTKKAATIIEHLRMFGRRATTSFEPVRINHVIRSAVSLMEAPLRHGGVQLILDVSPDDPSVMGNAIQLEQVLLNLLMNARDAVERAPQKTVRIASTVKGSHVEVLVSDTGNGIPAELQPRVFDPFFTTKDVGKGTGLGLSISYGIIMDHGGAISVDSEPNKGTTFTITLPLAGK